MNERIIIVCIMSIVMTIVLRIIIICWKWLKTQIIRHMEIMENIDDYLFYETEYGERKRKEKTEVEE